MDIFLQLIISGIMVGSIYALVALGWTIIYKCSGVLNLAMGELTLVGAYICLSFYAWGLPFIPALLATLVATFFLGLLIEHLVLRPMIGQPILAVIMITAGLSFFLRAIVALVWGTDTVIFKPPVFSAEPVRIGNMVFSHVYIWSCVAALVLLVAFVSFFQFTRWGLSMQATADDEMAALSLGVSAKRVYALAWAIACMASAVGGTLLGNINGLNISVGALGLLVLPAVVLGGLNSIPGAIVGGIVIGILQNLSDAYISRVTPGGVKEIAPFAFMVIILLFRPYGLWGWVKIERV